LSTVTLNGVDVSAGVWCQVEDGSGMLRGAALRTPGIVVPGVHGEALNVLPTYDAGTVVLPLLVKGVDRASGLQSGDGVGQLRDNVAYLSRLAHAPLVTIDHDFGDGVVRRAVGRMRSDPFEGERLVSNPPAARVAVVFTIPGAFWVDVNPTTTPTYSLATGETQELTPFAEATAPMDEMTIVFGAGSNPELTQTRGDGTTTLFAYNKVLTAGQSVSVNTTDWELVGGGGHTADLTAIRYEPRARWFELDPSSGAPIVRLTHTGGGTMQVQFTARRKYWVGG
jgi:hypothetical protein